MAGDAPGIAPRAPLAPEQSNPPKYVVTEYVSAIFAKGSLSTDEQLRWHCRLEGAVIVLGIILLVLGFILKIHIIWIIGIILLIVGVVLALLGATGRAVGGRRHWF